MSRKEGCAVVLTDLRLCPGEDMRGLWSGVVKSYSQIDSYGHKLIFDFRMPIFEVCLK